VLSAFIYRSKIWSRTIRLGWLSHKILRKISGPKREEFRNRVGKYTLNFAICSVACIVTRYGLEGPGIESRWGRDFPHPSRPALGLTQHSIQWAPDFFPGIKRQARGVDHSPQSNAEIIERVELYINSTYGSSRSVLGSTLPLPLPVPYCLLRAFMKIK
jgi:hypothetical protein